MYAVRLLCVLLIVLLCTFVCLVINKICISKIWVLIISLNRMCASLPMMPVSLDCPCFISPGYFLTFNYIVSCAPYDASFSLDCPFVFVPGYFLTFICLVSCVSYDGSFFGLSMFYCPWVFSNVYVLRLVHPMIPASLDFPCFIAPEYFPTCICLVSCVSHDDSLS